MVSRNQSIFSCLPLGPRKTRLRWRSTFSCTKNEVNKKKVVEHVQKIEVSGDVAVWLPCRSRVASTKRIRRQWVEPMAAWRIRFRMSITVATLLTGSKIGRILRRRQTSGHPTLPLSRHRPQPPVSQTETTGSASMNATKPTRFSSRHIVDRRGNTSRCYCCVKRNRRSTVGRRQGWRSHDTLEPATLKFIEWIFFPRFIQLVTSL